MCTDLGEDGRGERGMDREKEGTDGWRDGQTDGGMDRGRERGRLCSLEFDDYT